VQGGEGLIAELVRVEKEGGRISAREMSRWFSCCWRRFGDHHAPHQRICPRADEKPGPPRLARRDWSRANLAIEEFLRFISPVQFTKPRMREKTLDLGGVRVNKGDKIMPMLAAANMDPAANEHPERLNLERCPTGISPSGTGIHFCLATSLHASKAGARCKALFRRWPKLEMAWRTPSPMAPNGRVSGRLQACPCWCALNSYS